jgi:hypothetical protein
VPIFPVKKRKKKLALLESGKCRRMADVREVVEGRTTAVEGAGKF